MTWVKICGITNLEDALVAVDAGADAVGFVFYEKSPRYVTVETVREIVSKLPTSVEKVGVFVNEQPTAVSQIASQAKLTAVQFHGDEYQKPEMYSLPYESLLCIPADWVVHTFTKKGKVFGAFMAFPQNLKAIMLDSGSNEKRGGTGQPFNWRETAPYVAAVTQGNQKIVVAGGLSPQNVAEPIRLLKPWGVDVSSGVEERPGKKDPEKVRAFVRAVRECDRKSFG